MKSAVVLSALAAVVLGLAGCASTPTQVNTGPIKAGTFSFVDRGPGANPDFSNNSQAVHTMIQTAITRNLYGKGLAKVETGGDITVAYLVILGNNVATTSLNEYFGYGRDANALVDKAHTAETVKNQNPNYFEAGTLVIDLIDSKSHSLLNRSTVQREILRDATAQVRMERIQDVVDEALAKLKIQR